MPAATISQWFLGFVLVLSSLGVILLPKPVHACLSFLLTLLALASLYLQLSAEFIGVMQILVYAGAILVIFMFVIILFQDAHMQLSNFQPQCSRTLLIVAGVSFLTALVFLGHQLDGFVGSKKILPESYGTVQHIGQALYIDFFFPFEAIISVFLIAVVGALYIARKGA
jgi:NADH-quinone oxidoreductase subunit J